MKKIGLLLSSITVSMISFGQTVGIGTSTPHANAILHIQLGINTTNGLLVTGNYNGTSTIPNLGAGSRLMFYPGRAAFRVGHVLGSQWDNSNVGEFSIAMGYNTTAKGTYSSAMGYGTDAYGSFSTAMGYGTLANHYATAFGHTTHASGSYATAMGQLTFAGGDNSTAMGYFTLARGYSSTVVGMYNLAHPVNETSVSATTPLFMVGNGSEFTRTNAMVVRKSGDVEVDNLIISGGTKISLLQSGTATVGSSASAFTTVTVNFPAGFYDPPKVIATARNNSCSCNDTFVVTVRSVSLSSVTFNILRVDTNTGWGQNLELNWMAWE